MPNLEQGCYNAGFENLSILELAEKIRRKVDCDIEITESNDPRSYRQDSSKLISTGFEKRFSVDDAISEIIEVYDKNLLHEDDKFFTVKWMKKLKINS